jgi:cellulose synthase/poly-beta-1,6-N-acetylglucosamine synthase-like glycosyltransferase
MKASIIIAVYKDYKALELILNQLTIQNYHNFEVIIAEDACSRRVPDIISNYSSLDIIHCKQDDLGIRKMRSQNNAILVSTGEYLIFIDGDCIPYPDFISSHVSCASRGVVSSGRRVNLGPKFSQWIRDGKLRPSTIANNFFLFFIPLVIDGKEGHIESGFRLNPKSFIYNNVIKKLKRTTNILGCNFACFKHDIVAINGFDEGYGETAVGDDTDIEWRFIAFGLNIQSVKNIANVFHLYHQRKERKIPYYEEMIELMKKRKTEKSYIASIGLKSHNKD